MPIEKIVPQVQLPATGIDPTANVAAQAPAVVPQLSAADQALIAQTQAQFAGNAATTESTTATTGGAAPDANAAGAAAGPETPAPELTASQRIAAKIEAKKAQIAKLVDDVDKLEKQFRSADLLDSVVAGSVIVARVGRADTSREVQAQVVGVQTLESGDKRYKVYFGEGFDAETVVIQSSQIADVVQV